MVKEHEDANRTSEEALKKRKNAKLNHVIISEHVDKKVKYVPCYIAYLLLRCYLTLKCCY
jgi:hypothetical protein